MMTICRKCGLLNGGPYTCTCMECDVCGELNREENYFTVHNSCVCDECFESALGEVPDEM